MMTWWKIGFFLNLQKSKNLQNYKKIFFSQSESLMIATSASFGFCLQAIWKTKRLWILKWKNKRSCRCKKKQAKRVLRNLHDETSYRREIDSKFFLTGNFTWQGQSFPHWTQNKPFKNEQKPFWTKRWKDKMFDD